MADYFSNPPPGLDLSENRTASNNAVGAVLFGLSAVFVGLRLLTRLKYQHAALGLDDWLMFFGLGLNAGNLACCIAGGFFGLGRHIYVLTPYDMRQISIITFAYVFIYAWSVCIIKFSIIALYRRIFGMTLLGWWCVFLTTGYLITNHIVLPLYTKPLSYYWDQWYGVKGVVQVNEGNFYLGIGIINLFGDLCILSVPIRNVWRLQMSRPQKFIIMFMFLLGSFVCFASLYRIVTIIRLTKTTDISWAKSDVFIWSSVEPSIGIISGCLPTLRPVLMHILHDVFGYDLKSSGSDNGGPPYPTLETISKKRTRKVRNRDVDAEVLNETQLTQFGDERDDGGNGEIALVSSPGKTKIRFGKIEAETGRWRPDEDEMCLTTTVVEGRNASKTNVGCHTDKDVESQGCESRDGIKVEKQFFWGEETGETR